MKRPLFFVLIIFFLNLMCCKPEKETTDFLFLAFQTAQSGNYLTAIDILEKNIKEKDRGFSFYFYRGLYYRSESEELYSGWALNDFKKAYEFNKEDYEFNKENYAINDMLGDTLVILERYQEAIPFLEKTFLIKHEYQDMIPPFWDLAEAYLHTGRIDDALRVNTEGIELDGEFSWYYMQRGIILSQDGDVSVLSEYYNIALSLDPDDIYNHNLHHREYALRLIEMGFYEDAKRICENLIAGNEKYYWCYADIGYIYMLGNDFTNAQVHFEKALSINSVDHRVLKYSSFFYFLTGDYDRAFELDAHSRLRRVAEGYVYRKTSIEEFIEYYEDDWAFTRIVKKLSE